MPQMNDISPIAAATGRTGSAAAAAPAAGPAVDFQSFLRLLTAQLENQDPLSPLDSTQFVAQLAGFSTVEQLVRANERLDAIAGGADAGLDRYASWIGREAVIAGGPLVFDGEPAEFRIEPNPDADRIEAVISDAFGREAARLALYNTGDSQYWDGSTAGGMAPGATYAISVEYYRNGELARQGVATTFDRVAEAGLAAGAPELRLASGRRIAPGDIVGLRSLD